MFYPQYFVLMNELVEDWFNEGLGVDFARFHAEDRHGIPMAHIECDFLAPSKVGETLAFGLSVRKIGAILAHARRRSPRRRRNARARHARRRPGLARHAAGGALLDGSEKFAPVARSDVRRI